MAKENITQEIPGTFLFASLHSASAATAAVVLQLVILDLVRAGKLQLHLRGRERRWKLLYMEKV